MKKDFWQHLGSECLNIVFPPACVSCGEILPCFTSERGIFCRSCLPCWNKARLSIRDTVVADMPADGMVGPLSLVRYHADGKPGVAERMIYYLKHEDDNLAFAYAGEHLSPVIRDTLRGMGVPTRDLLVTYPPRRPEAKRKYGFDQAMKLSKFLAKNLEGENVSLIARTGRRTQEQKRLTAAERAENAVASYCLNEKNASLVSGRVIILVDDLYTTGATLRTCAELLLDAGALLVVLATVGKTERAEVAEPEE